MNKQLLDTIKSHPVPTALIFAVLLSAIVPPLLANYWVFLATAGMLTAIVALGIAVIVGWVGEITLASGALLGTSVYVSGYLLRQGTGNFHSWPFIPTIIVSVVAAAALSGFVSLATVRFSGIYVMVLTLGLQITLERTLFAFPWIIGGFGRNIVITRPKFLGVSFDSDLRFFYLCFGAMLVSALFVHSLRRSRHGRAMNLVRADRRAAAAVGISPWRYKILAFVIGGGLIGFAGAFTASLYRAPPAPVQYVAFQSLFLLAIPIVAGTDTLVGIVGVAIAFALIPQSLESHHLSPFLLGGIGLVAGTLVGARGMGGVTLDMLQKKQEIALLKAAGEIRVHDAVDPGLAIEGSTPSEGGEAV